MIHIKSDEEVELMRQTCALAAEVLLMIEPYVKPGVTTNKLDQICHDYIIEHGATPSPLNYRGFPKSICASINEEICHGIPSDRTLRNGDVVNLDITTYLNGYHGDTSRTFFVGSPRKRTSRLVEVCRDALGLGIEQVKPGARLGDIGATIQQFVEKHDYTVVREFCGHGIGKNFHEEPQVLHYGRFGEGLELKKNMIFTIEPMVNEGKPDLRILADKWTAVTQDGSTSVQFEHTIHVTETGYDVLTRLDGRTPF
ncbi:MAG: type I methionyl aminopeptidase [Candidatus Nitrohelix vancouverensis]|uniref:Methionine aminopeptidase n=1 Tax=Candidatus Nitrohelix vancouverensis TaxID=2705534 RepID=A0A7T0C4I9_9BACT|nr:MAG: type I methionyl aminopeptidase [Candidatus Nitrohelix vancouverensis]